MTPLNDSARASVGNGASLAEYHKLVRSRYADKLPGSSYDRDGRAGGFQAQAPSAGTENAGAGTLTAGLVLAGVGVAGAVTVAWRRSRASQA
ncbi:MAG: hypothetical protein HOV83_37345 [Catenulispora sp.]|nr:hypothetical protein [Catenulispora sp.]